MKKKKQTAAPATRSELHQLLRGKHRRFADSRQKRAKNKLQSVLSGRAE